MARSSKLRTEVEKLSPTKIFIEGVFTGAVVAGICITGYECAKGFWDAKEIKPIIRKEDWTNVTVTTEVQHDPSTGEAFMVATQTGMHPSSETPILFNTVKVSLKDGVPSELHLSEELSLEERLSGDKTIQLCRHKITPEDVAKQMNVFAEAERAMNVAQKVQQEAIEKTRRAYADLLNNAEISVGTGGVSGTITNPGNLIYYHAPALARVKMDEESASSAYNQALLQYGQERAKLGHMQRAVNPDQNNTWVDGVLTVVGGIFTLALKLFSF